MAATSSETPMGQRLFERIKKIVIRRLNKESIGKGFRLHDFEALRSHLRIADVVLVEGRARVSGVVQSVTLSNWSHAALYVGRVCQLPDRAMRGRVKREHGWNDEVQLVLEAELGRGTILSSLDKYRDHHVRICRPQGLVNEDADHLVSFALNRLGTPYDIRQIFDLARFFFPYGLLPRRWRSSLFDFRSGDHARTVCSTLIAEAFACVHFPILPIIQRNEKGRYTFAPRNFRLCAPRDFDNSPYFEIVKYPFLGGNDIKLYKQMRWDNQHVLATPANQDVLTGGRDTTPSTAD